MPTQFLMLQESIERLDGRTPSKIACYLTDDLADGSLRMGDRVTVVGVIFPDFSTSTKTGMINNYAEIVSLEKASGRFDEVKITRPEANIIRDIAASKEVYDVLVESFAPRIYGMKDEKLALLCSLFGSPPSDINEDHVRGDIHTLLVGSPALAKSQLIKFAYKVSPRGVYAMGQRASGPGLTCSWTMGLDKRPELQPGAMAMADGGGIVVIDEGDKLDASDRGSIHGPMEDQFVGVAMAGQIQQINTRCAVVMSCNPKRGTYDPNNDILYNTNLDPPLLSRFDTIFILVDKVDPLLDSAVNRHITNYNAGLTQQTPLDMDMLRKYVAYCRQQSNPVLVPDSEAYKVLNDGYNELRAEGDSGKIKATRRTFISLSRIAKSLARMQLNGKVSVDNAMLALKLYKHSSYTTTLELEVFVDSKLEEVKQAIIDSADKDRKVYIPKLLSKYVGMESIVQDAAKQLKVIKEGENYWVLP